jgi:hypothetical protein
MKILVISPNFWHQTVWSLGLYIDALYKAHKPWFFGPGYEHHNGVAHVNDIIAMMDTKPDLLCFHQPQHFAHIKGLPELRIPKIVHVGEYGFNGFEWVPDWIDNNKFDLMVSDFKSNTDTHARRGRTPTLWHVWGTDTEVFKDEGKERDLDVSCLYSVRHYTEGPGPSAQYPRRLDAIHQINESGVRSFARGICAENQNILSGSEYTGLLNRSRMSIDSPDRDRNIHQRWMEISACGAVLLAYEAGRREHLDLGFKQLTNCVFYDPFSEDNLKKTIRTLVHDSELLQSIAHAGKAFIKEHFDVVRTSERFWRKAAGIL